MSLSKRMFLVLVAGLTAFIPAFAAADGPRVETASYVSAADLVWGAGHCPAAVNENCVKFSLVAGETSLALEVFDDVADDVGFSVSFGDGVHHEACNAWSGPIPAGAGAVLVAIYGTLATVRGVNPCGVATATTGTVTATIG